jgi:hypothetical protein
MGLISLISPELRRLEARPEQALGLFRFAGLAPFPGFGGLLDWRLLGRLSRLAMDGFLTGAEGERLLFPLGGRLPQRELVICGLGPRERFGRERFQSALGSVFAALHGLGARGVILPLPGRLEGACDAGAAVDWFFEVYEEHGGGHDVAIVESVEAHRDLAPAIERWQLRRSVPAGS